MPQACERLAVSLDIAHRREPAVLHLAIAVAA
ncbi:hypothetical protein QO017_003294 [Methylobacterium gregans]|nr:hypothetical protein [Methylobacterium gregans]